MSTATGRSNQSAWSARRKKGSGRPAIAVPEDRQHDQGADQEEPRHPETARHGGQRDALEPTSLTGTLHAQKAAAQREGPRCRRRW